MASDDEKTDDAVASDHDQHDAGHGGHNDEHGDHADGHADDRRAYDPHKIELPSREPPLRSTAPQSDFATTQVVRGAVILLIGLALTFGLGIVLA